LEENIVESKELKVKIKAEKQPEYGNISAITLTNFCDSLETNLDIIYFLNLVIIKTLQNYLNIKIITLAKKLTRKK